MKRLINEKIITDKSLKVSLIGGGFIDDELMFEADKLGWKPFRVYGSSETGSMITAISANEIKNLNLNQLVNVFQNVEIKISDDSEILIKSNCLFKNIWMIKKKLLQNLINDFFIPEIWDLLMMMDMYLLRQEEMI